MSDSEKAMIPGSFDPPTYGHLDMIERCSRLYKETDVVIADNIKKHCMFSPKERKAMLEELTSSYPNVHVTVYPGLVVDYAREHGVGVLIRGIRTVVDFGAEFEAALINKKLNSDLEVLFMPTSEQCSLLRSSTIKELASFGADVSKFVPPLVSDALKRKMKENPSC
jgi:pantetheine-phosphate adenylyltransferase